MVTPKAVGYNVLVELIVKERNGLIHLSKSVHDSDVAQCEIARIVDIGPIAFVGYEGCNPSLYPADSAQFKMTPSQIYGVDIGDIVEVAKYEGRKCVLDGFERFRYLPDSLIQGKHIEVEL